MAMYYKQNNEWKKIFVSKEEISDDVLNSKQDKLTVGSGLKLENNVLSLDIETATAQTTYGGDTQ